MFVVPTLRLSMLDARRRRTHVFVLARFGWSARSGKGKPKFPATRSTVEFRARETNVLRGPRITGAASEDLKTHSCGRGLCAPGPLGHTQAVNSAALVSLQPKRQQASAFLREPSRSSSHHGELQSKIRAPNPTLERTSSGMARRSSQAHVPLRRATPAAVRSALR